MYIGVPQQQDSLPGAWVVGPGIWNSSVGGAVLPAGETQDSGIEREVLSYPADV